MRSSIEAEKVEDLSILCGPPACLFPFFASHYYANISRQYEIVKSNTAIFYRAMASCENPEKMTGLAFMKLVYAALVDYKKPADVDANDFYKVIESQNNPFHQNYVENVWNAGINTAFSLDSFRALINFLVLQDVASHPAFREITVSEFCVRASQFLNIDLIFSPEIANVKIARIGQEKTGEYRHRLHMLFSKTKKTPMHLFSLYDQLLSIIFNQSDVTENIEKTNDKKLHAIFLLTFLIGSNPPVYIEKGVTGGAFVTEIVMQMLLKMAGFKPIRKNFLSLPEIALLSFYGENTLDSWLKPLRCYQASCAGEVNDLFHPVSDNEHTTLLTYLNQFSVPENFDEEQRNDYFAIIMVIKLSLLDSMQSDEYRNKFLEILNSHDTFQDVVEEFISICYLNCSSEEQELINQWLLKNLPIEASGPASPTP